MAETKAGLILEHLPVDLPVGEAIQPQVEVVTLVVTPHKVVTLIMQLEHLGLTRNRLLPQIGMIVQLAPLRAELRVGCATAFCHCVGGSGACECIQLFHPKRHPVGSFNPEA